MSDESGGRWSLKGRRALVTGGTKGIGAAIAVELMDLGASVTIVARDADAVAAQVAAWRKTGADAHGFAADMTTPEGRNAAIQGAVDAMGGLDILINNVGVSVRKRTLDLTAEEYERVFSTSLTSAWELCRLAHPYLKAAPAPGGSIVNISSVAGSVAIGSGSPYGMAKAALDQLTRYLAVEWAEDNIRVNAVDPAYTRTPLAEPVLKRPEFEAAVRARTPLDRVAEPEDVAAPAAFLCLPAARHITGQIVMVDGGWLAKGLDFSLF